MNNTIFFSFRQSSAMINEARSSELEKKMNEFQLIHSIKQSHYQQSSLIKGIGDDAAVFRQNYRDIITAVDTFVEGVHFTRKTMSPKQIGYRLLAVNLSDIAAMGAEPVFYLVSAVIPSYWEKNISDVYRGMNTLASEYNIDLIGGDTVTGKQLTLSMTIIGYVDEGRARYRHDARDQDVVFVTGTLGDARAGLHILQSAKQFINTDYYINRHQSPTPRVKFSQALQNIPRIALNDISDGIASEASEMATASQKNIVLDNKLLPESANYKQFPKQLRKEWKLFGGEDFELLGTVGLSDWENVKSVAIKTNTPITKVGYVTQEPIKNQTVGQVYLYENGKKSLIDKRGYTHLS